MRQRMVQVMYSRSGLAGGRSASHCAIERSVIHRDQWSDQREEKAQCYELPDHGDTPVRKPVMTTITAAAASSSIADRRNSVVPSSLTNCG